MAAQEGVVGFLRDPPDTLALSMLLEVIAATFFICKPKLEIENSVEKLRIREYSQAGVDRGNWDHPRICVNHQSGVE